MRNKLKKEIEDWKKLENREQSDFHILNLTVIELEQMIKHRLETFTYNAHKDFFVRILNKIHDTRRKIEIVR